MPSVDELPDLTTPEGLAVASDMLSEQGWAFGGCLPSDPKDALKVLLGLCPDVVLHELACRYAETVLPVWEAKHPDDSRPREAVNAKRAWVAGSISAELLDAQGDLDAMSGRVRVDFSVAEACAVLAARAATHRDAAEAAAAALRAAVRVRTNLTTQDLSRSDAEPAARNYYFALTIAYMLEVGPA